MKKFVFAVVSLAALAVAHSAPAQDAAPAQDVGPTHDASAPGLLPAGPADGCELHIWPAERMTSVSGGGLIGAAINGKRNSTNQSLMASALDSPSQLDALTSLDLRQLLNRSPGTTIVLHDTPLERHTMNSIKTRRADSASKCYSELIVADVLYTKAPLYGRSLKTLFMFRDFGNDQTIDAEYKAWGGNGLKLFPPKEGEDAIAALDELVTKFKQNFDEYSRNERAWSKTRRS